MKHQTLTHLLFLLNTFLLTIFVITSCKKDINFTSEQPKYLKLSIEEAKEFYFKTINRSSNNDVLENRNDSTLVIPDWQNAIQYFDEVKNQYVVEVPILEGWFTRHLINPDNIQVDTSEFFESPVHNSLIIVRDTQGVTDYAIMKIEGTYKYIIDNEPTSSNTYFQLDQNFAGLISYVDIDDRLRSAFYVHGGHSYSIDSVNVNIDGLDNSVAQDRWEIICFRIYEWVPPHCDCGPGGNPSQLIAGHWLVFEDCYDATVVNDSYNPPYTPPYNPNPTWQPNGNGGSGNPNNGVSCLNRQVNAFNAKYSNMDLLTEYEDAALTCFYQGNMSCSTTLDPVYEECVIKSILTSNSFSYQLSAYATYGPLNPVLNAITDAIMSGYIKLEAGIDVFQAAITFGATSSQVSILLQLAHQNNNIDFYKYLVVNYGFDDPNSSSDGPPISTTKLACPGLFDFITASDPSPGPPPFGQNPGTWTSTVACLTDIHYSFTYQGSSIPIVQKSLGIVINRQTGTATCAQNSSNIGATLLNKLVSDTQADVNGLSPGQTQEQVTAFIIDRIYQNVPIAFNFALDVFSCNGYGGESNAFGDPLAFTTYWAGLESTNCDERMNDCP